MKLYEVTQDPEDKNKNKDDRPNSRDDLGYDDKSWKEVDWKKLRDRRKKNTIKESVNEDQIFLFLMNKLEVEHPEMIDRIGQDEVLDVVMDVADELASSNQFNSRNADQYIIQILRRLEND